MKKEKYYILDNGTKSISYVIFGLIVFFFIFFPFFAVNLRYQVGTVLIKIFGTIGRICILTGSAITLVCIVGTFTGRVLRFKYFIVGIVLLWVGSWCTGKPFELWGIIPIGTEQTSPGYH
ncbi:MAG: hypothetical protein ACW98X_06130 [Promethearchaeota archaeon]|jgi:hypothetical protein